ncbi:MAG TPA: TetR/AcrR family transcriptional regulator [Thermoanaerobaculia bacterium]|nr:TetR/AcrR family transcriptional regulator [Thermoanaerobaculia bacterium]
MKSYHHGDLRAALLAAAVDLIREAGAESLSLREVARRSGVSQTAPYRHFRDKEDLTAGIAEEGFTILGDEMRKAAGGDGAPRERLMRGGRAYVAFALKRPEHFKVMFATDLDAKRHPAARTAADNAFAGLLALVTAAFPKRAPLTLARMAWSQVHGIATLAIGKQFRFRTQAEVLAFAEEAMQALARGM